MKFLRDMRAHASMLEFSLGERVSFEPDGRGPLFVIVRRTPSCELDLAT